MSLKQDIKDIIELEITRDIEQGRLKPKARLKHLLEHINWKIDQIAELNTIISKPTQIITP